MVTSRSYSSCLHRLGIGGVGTVEKHGAPGFGQFSVHCQLSLFELLQALLGCNRWHGEHGGIGERSHSVVGAAEYPLTQVEKYGEMSIAGAKRVRLFASAWLGSRLPSQAMQRP